AAHLRQFGWMGAITLIGEEPVPPYQRPPLSKGWLKGEADAATVALRPASFYPANGITLRLSTLAVAIDRTARMVTLATGEVLGYDRLVLALGARPRKLVLPGIELPGVLELRTAADADRLQAVLGPGRRFVVIGGGYIGLEAAAAARSLGTETTVIEREERVLARVACAPVLGFFQDYHRARGVHLVLDTRIEAIEGADQPHGQPHGRATGVRLSDGRLVPCDAVLVGVGVAPEEALARTAGLACESGIVVDQSARTSDAIIYAIGDCTRRPVPLYGCSVRLESVPNALEQAKQAAADICGRPPPAPEVPWFWSDQFDLRLQIVGLPIGAAEVLVRGKPATGSFAAFHLDADARLLAVEAVNAVPEFMVGRMLIAKRARVAPARLQDVSVSMKDVAA
ncbi:MAG: FAD-dependent oxidoreductase, partial [Pseudomonadota bacterium]|nr:FAD-dependent oxidoreductase [Pseudomonadota bacterium]